MDDLSLLNPLLPEQEHENGECAESNKPPSAWNAAHANGARAPSEQESVIGPAAACVADDILQSTEAVDQDAGDHGPAAVHCSLGQLLETKPEPLTGVSNASPTNCTDEKPATEATTCFKANGLNGLPDGALHSPKSRTSSVLVSLIDSNAPILNGITDTNIPPAILARLQTS